MSHFTVFADMPKPGKTYPRPKQHNCADQLVIFDGKSSPTKIHLFAEEAREYFHVVHVFSGKNLGKLTSL